MSIQPEEVTLGLTQLEDVVVEARNLDPSVVVVQCADEPRDGRGRIDHCAAEDA